MEIEYAYHATLRMKQRNITTLEIEHILCYPEFIKRVHGCEEFTGNVNGKRITLITQKVENYLKIITLY